MDMFGLTVEPVRYNLGLTDSRSTCDPSDPMSPELTSGLKSDFGPLLSLSQPKYFSCLPKLAH